MIATSAACLLALSGCATGGDVEPSLPPEQTAALLAGESVLQGRPLPPVEEQDILGIDEDMRRFLEDRVDGSTRLPERLEQLLDAVVEDASFGLNYEGYTRTASETFHYRNGNCLAFTNMFVALARSVGLDAAYQEVDIPPVWDRQGDMIVLSRHVNVNVQNVPEEGGYGLHAVWGRRNEHGRIIDFNVTEFRTFFRTHVISDERAFAHFYSNLGAEAVRDNKYPEALAYLRKSLAYEPGFSAAWSNLGVLYSHVGDLPTAKLAYERALFHDPDSITTRSNLASVLRQLGDTEQATKLSAEVEAYRNRSPYYRYHLATQAVSKGHYEEALDHLKYAVKKQPREERFHFALSVVYTKMGDTERAKKELEEAKSLASNIYARQRYDVKLRQLRISVEEEAGAAES